MGVTIAYEGSVRDAVARGIVLETARSFARTRDWAVDNTPLGVVITPHQKSEPVVIEFDKLSISGSTKTQFAGARVHWQVVELFKALQPAFVTLEIDDDASAWDGASPQDVEALFTRFQERIDHSRAQLATASDADSDGGVHPVLQTLLIGLVMLALLIAGGFAYSWWIGLL